MNKNTELINAINENDITTVDKLLNKEGADVNVQDDNGFTALIFASRNNDSSNVQKLLDKGANVNLQTKYGLTALMSASNYYGNAEIVQKLLDKGADVNLYDENGETALMSACLGYHNLEIVKKLLDKGADVNLQNKDGETALMMTCRTFECDECDKCDENDCNKCHTNFVEIAQKLLDKGADVNLQSNEGETALMISVTSYRCKKELVHKLLDKGADVNLQDKNGKTALMNVHEDVEIVKKLLDKGADPTLKDKNGFSALSNAIFFYSKEILEIYIAYYLSKNLIKDLNEILYRYRIENTEYKKLLEFVERANNTPVMCMLTNSKAPTDDIKFMLGIYKDYPPIINNNTIDKMLKLESTLCEKKFRLLFNCLDFNNILLGTNQTIKEYIKSKDEKNVDNINKIISEYEEKEKQFLKTYSGIDCPICLDKLEGSNGYVCNTCKNAICKVCFEKLKKERKHIPCVICRTGTYKYTKLDIPVIPVIPVIPLPIKNEGDSGRRKRSAKKSKRSPKQSKRSPKQSKRSPKYSKRSQKQSKRSQKHSKRSKKQSKRSPKQSKRSLKQSKRSKKQSKRSPKHF